MERLVIEYSDKGLTIPSKHKYNIYLSIYLYIYIYIYILYTYIYVYIYINIYDMYIYIYIYTYIQYIPKTELRKCKKNELEMHRISWKN